MSYLNNTQINTLVSHIQDKYPELYIEDSSIYTKDWTLIKQDQYTIILSVRKQYPFRCMVVEMSNSNIDFDTANDYCLRLEEYINMLKLEKGYE